MPTVAAMTPGSAQEVLVPVLQERGPKENHKGHKAFRFFTKKAQFNKGRGTIDI